MLLKIVPLVWVLIMSILFLSSHIHMCNNAMSRHSLGREVIFFLCSTLFEGKTLLNKLWPLLDSRAKLDLRLTKSFLFLVSLQPHELTKNATQNKKYGDDLNLVICVFLLPPYLLRSQRIIANTCLFAWRHLWMTPYSKLETGCLQCQSCV